MFQVCQQYIMLARIPQGEGRGGKEKVEGSERKKRGGEIKMEGEGKRKKGEGRKKTKQMVVSWKMDKV